MSTAAVIMARSASLLNDTARVDFTYAAMLPYLQMAVDELQEVMEQYNVPYTNKVNVALNLTAGMVSVGGGSGAPSLPGDLIDVRGIYERTQGSTDSYVEMTRVEFLPAITVLTNDLIYWAWNGQVIQFLGANSNRNLRIEYIASLLTVVDETSDIPVFNSTSFLSYRTAALCAQFIGENKERSDDLNIFAQLAIDRLLSISIKSRQAISVRRRPFMASYRRLGGGNYI